MNKPANAPVVISQAMLAQYKFLQEREIQIKAAREKLRAAIISLWHQKARVQGGPLCCDVSRKTMRQVTAKAVLSALGKEALDVVLQNLEPTDYQQLVVRESAPPTVESCDARRPRSVPHRAC